jgi:cytochrome b561
LNGVVILETEPMFIRKRGRVMKMQSNLVPLGQAVGPVPKVAAGHRHSYGTIALHWASVLALMLAAAAALWREWLEDESLRTLLMQVHKQAGLFVMVALVLRVAVRIRVGFADHAGPMHVVVRWAAQMAHLGLYGLLLALPVLGIALCNASAIELSFFGLFKLPSFLQDDPDLAATLSDSHVWAAWIMLVMVGLHVAAALWHHVVRRDGVLVAMLPLLRRRARVGPGRRSEVRAPAEQHGPLEFPPLRDAA